MCILNIELTSPLLTLNYNFSLFSNSLQLSLLIAFGNIIPLAFLLNPLSFTLATVNTSLSLLASPLLLVCGAGSWGHFRSRFKLASNRSNQILHDYSESIVDVAQVSDQVFGLEFGGLFGYWYLRLAV